MCSYTHHDGALLSVVAVEADHVPEREIADDIRVEHEERLVVGGQDVAGERQRAGRAQRLRLQREGNLNSQLWTGTGGYVRPGRT